MLGNSTSLYGTRPFENALGDRIKELREMHGESQADLATALNLNQRATIEQWEKGTRFIKAGQLVEIAKHFDVSTDYLLGITDVATTDIELQSICKYTNLTEQAVKRIACDKYMGEKSFSNILSKIFEGRSWIFFCNSLETYLSNYEKLDSFLCSAHERLTNAETGDLANAETIANELEHAWQNDGLCMQLLYSGLRYGMFDIAEAAKEIVHEICNDRDVNDRVCNFVESFHEIHEKYDKSELAKSETGEK